MTTAARLMSAEAALQRGDRSGAIGQAMAAALTEPGSSDAAFFLGLLRHPGWHGRALAIAPDHIGAALNLAAALDGAGMRPAALRVLRRAIVQAPSLPPSLVNAALMSSAEAALPWLRRAVAAAPDDVIARLNLATTLDRLNLAGAPEHRRVVALAPDHPLATTNQALAAFAATRLDEAGRWHRRTLALDLQAADALAGLGAVARDQQQRTAGRAWDRKALVLRPDHAPTLANIAHGDFILGDAASALTWARRAEHAEPEAPAYGNTALAIAYYLPVADSDALLARCQSWVRRHAPAPAVRPVRGAVSARPKVGILSNDLGDHPVGWLVLSLFERHPRIRLHAYTDSRRDEPMARTFKSLADDWTFTGGLSDAEVAERMRRDGLDVLVVLAGRTLGTRLLVAAHGGAPVQASLYDFGASGVDAMDWIVTDDALHPPDSRERLTERLWRVPTLFVARAPEILPPIRPRAEGGPTFISCNHPAKLTEEVGRLWARVLAAVPGSRLILKYGGTYAEPVARRRVARVFEAEGVGSERLTFLTEHLTRDKHLALVSDADIALDPFPFNGSTTTLEALWMGVPVLTLAGDSFISRMGVSILTALGRPELIATGEADYIAKTVALAGDRARLAAMRPALRREMQTAMLGDIARHAASFEGAFLAMAS